MVLLVILIAFGISLGAWAQTDPPTVPVAGVRAERLRSSFGAPRAAGQRRHQGIDIFARRGTPVVAARAGVVVFVGTLPIGGKVVHVLGQDALYYYAHLDDWADGLAPGQIVGQGQKIGEVGNTGNARGTRPHLHFEIRPLSRLFRAIDPATELGRGRARR